MAATRFLDLIKKLTKAKESETRPRFVGPTQPDVKPDFATGLGGGTRPRYATGEPDQLTKLKEEGEWLAGGDDRGRGGSILQKPSRVKSALMLMLQNAGAAANRALASGNVGSGGVAQALGGAAGGAIAGGFDPGIVLRQRHERAVLENQEAQDRALSQLSNEAQLEDLRSRARNRDAEIDATKENQWLKAEDQRLREKDIDRRTEYDRRSAELRQAAIEGRMTIAQWRTEQAKLDRESREREGAANREVRRAGIAARIGNSEDKIGQATAKRTALINYSSSVYKKADNNELNARQLEQTLNRGELFDDSGNRISDPYEAPQEVERRKREIDRLRSEARDLRVQGDKARSEGESTYIPSRKPTATPKTDPLGLFTPDNHQFSKSAWLATHPGGDLNEAIRVARARGYAVID